MFQGATRTSPHLGPTWANLGRLEPTWGQLSPNLGPAWPNLYPTWSQLRPKIKPNAVNCAFWGPPGASLGPTWADLGPTWGQFGPTNVKLGPTYDQLGQQLRANWGSTNEQPKTLYGITSRKVFRDRCRPFAQNSYGSVAGSGGLPPAG